MLWHVLCFKFYYMETTLNKKKVAILVADGFEESEFTQPLEALKKAQAEVDVISLKPGKVKAWKDKDYEKINLMYQRSGINLLIASLGIFLLVWLNYGDAVHTFKLKPAYLQSQWIFFFLGLARVVDLGTGVNSQIIGTSTFWRFEFISGMVLLTLAVPLNYFLVKHYGIIGAGYSTLISYSIYNTIRIIFLQRKFNMHPFSMKTVYAIILAVISYIICYYAFQSLHGFWAMVLRSIVFIALYGGSIIYLDLTPDVLPVLGNLKKRIYRNRD